MGIALKVQVQVQKVFIQELQKYTSTEWRLKPSRVYMFRHPDDLRKHHM